MPERGVIYGRASKDPRASGSSVNKQLERGRDFAAREGVSVVEEVRDDNSSASRGSRERVGFRQVRELIARGDVDLLILWEVSRSSRDLEEFMGLVNACDDNDIDIVVSGTRYDPANVDHWLPLVFAGVLAEAEARRIQKRNIDSVETNARRGTPHGRIPYGYRREYDSRTGVLINQTPFSEAHPDRLLPEAQVLVDASKSILRGVTLRQICRDLEAAGVLTPRRPRAKTLEENPGGVVTRWDPQTLRQLLLNPTIAGRRVHRGEDIGPASWPPIVEYDEWLRVRAVLTDPSRLTVTTPRGPAPRHLLSGIARCGECGARLKAATNMSRIDRAYTCRSEGCMKVTVVADRVDERVEAVLHAWFRRSDFRASLADAVQRRKDAATAGPDLASLIEEKEQLLAEIDALRAAEEMSMRTYLVETARVEALLQELRNQQTSSVPSGALRRVLRADSLETGWVNAELVDRREVVRLLLDVTVNRATVKGRNFDGRRVVIRPGTYLAAELDPPNLTGATLD